MKTTNFTAKLFLVIALFASTLFAEEGQMGSGGLADEGQMGSGGYTCTVTEDENCPTGDDEDLTDSYSLIEFVKDYLVQMMD